METLIWFIVAMICIFLMLQKWFWILAFGVGGLASAFSTLASIFHFEILWALGFFFLMVICFFAIVAMGKS